MYLGYIEDRILLDYPTLKDRSCGTKLVLITNSTVLSIRNLPSNINHKTKRVILVITLVSAVWFSNLESVEAIGLSVPPTPVVKVQPNYKHTYEMKVAPTVNPRLDKILMLSTNRIYLNGYDCYFSAFSIFLKIEIIKKEHFLKVKFLKKLKLNSMEVNFLCQSQKSI